MTAARPSRPQPRSSAPVQIGFDWGDALHAVLAAAVSGLVIARLLLPTEGAAQGDTLLIAQGWLALLLLWSMQCLSAGRFSVRLGWADVAVSLLVGGHVLSVVMVLMTTGDKRSALNMLWEWMSLGVSFFLIRQVFSTVLERRLMAGVLVAATISLAGYGIWQNLFWYPQLVRDYQQMRTEADELDAEKGQPRDAARWQSRMRLLRERLLQQGLDGSILEGSGRAQFEARLMDSREPLGRFALANSFAGLLLVGLTLLGATFLEVLFRSGERRGWQLLLLGFACLLVAYCLLLTKSRTAYLGLAASVFVLIVGQIRNRGVSPRKLLLWGAGAAAIIAALLGIGMLSGGIDRQVLSESLKSLRYRQEYWQSTWSLIREHPLLGVGPGNFRQNYLRHKLPQSSEEILDPHNLFLDAWANGGVLALVGLSVICLLTVGLLLWKPFPDSEASPPIPVEPWYWQPIAWGGLAAYLGAFSATSWADDSLLALAAGWLVAMAFVGQSCGKWQLDQRAWGAALIGLMLHLCGAGGMGMPAIAQILLLLLAFSTLESNTAASSTVRQRDWKIFAVATAAGVLFCVCLFTATWPVMAREAYLQQGNFAATYEERRRAYEQAAQADPLSSEPWENLASNAFQRWLQGKGQDQRLFDEAVASQQKAIKRDPANYNGYRTLANFYRERFRLTKAPESIRLAAENLLKAAKLYPQRADLQAELAETWQAVSRLDLAQQAATQALRLDDLNHQAGHSDKYLPAATRQKLEALAGQP